MTYLYWWKNMTKHKLSPDIFSEISIVQPLVSGDPQLPGFLRENVVKNPTTNFVWVTNKMDTEAQKITQALIDEFGSERLKLVLVGEPAAQTNDKVVKQNAGLTYSQKYFFALDDDTFIDLNNLSIIADRLDEDAIFSGLPFYQAGKGFLTKMVTGFVNGNSITSYLPMALTGKNYTANGMCYIIKSDILKNLDIFNRVMDRLCDEYEIAKILQDNKIDIVQTVVPCKVSTSIRNLSHYVTLMKRWMIFSRVYIKDNKNWRLLALIVAPSIFLLFTLLIILFTKPILLPLFFIVHWAKAAINRLMRKKMVNSEEPLSATGYEMLAEYITPLHFVHSIISPNTILWRNRKIDVSKPTIHYLD